MNNESYYKKHTNLELRSIQTKTIKKAWHVFLDRNRLLDNQSARTGVCARVERIEYKKRGIRGCV